VTRGAAELKELAERALVGSAERGDLLGFLQQHIRPRPNQRWTLERHEYLRAIAEDRSRVIVVEKAAQLGISTLFIGDLFHTCLAGHHAGYFLDTSGRMQRFVQGKIDPIINASEELTRHVAAEKVAFGLDLPKRRGGRPADNVQVKRVGSGLAYFLSTYVMGEVKLVDLDMIVMDEVAELDEEKAEFAQDRLLHSDLKLERWLSQPDIPHMDIDDLFQRSDQKYWKIRCRRCRTWTALELAFPDCLVQVKGEWRMACPRCHARLYREDGEWVAVHPEREISGYHVTQLYGPHITAKEIAAQWERAQTRPSRMRRFVISILGKPHSGDRQRITDALLNERCGEWQMSSAGKMQRPPGAPYAGIDVGDVIHLVIARFGDDGVARTVWLEETGDWDVIERRLRDHGVRMLVIDAMPEKTKAKELCLKLKCGAIIYTGAKRTSYGIEDKETKPVHTISTNRTEMLDNLTEALSAGAFWLPKPTLPETQRAREHFKRLVRDRQDDGTYRYRRGVENHFGMAAAHMLMARDAQGALHLAPAGHFEPVRTGQDSKHIVGQTHAPRRW